MKYDEYPGRWRQVASSFGFKGGEAGFIRNPAFLVY